MLTSNGYLIWAGTNLSYLYTFAAGNGPAYGYYFTWATALNACPTGWRLPTLAETASLTSLTTKSYYSAGYYWTLTSPTGTMYLPLSGTRASGNGSTGTDNVNNGGFYQTSDSKDTSTAYVMMFNTSGGTTTYVSKAYGESVRCVRDCYRGYVK